uniref:Uncharacterized protein n=1 Tax=Arion vulgaris TaxID=1028688 RepID=A0A0B6ZYR0_9EUPU
MLTTSIMEATHLNVYISEHKKLVTEEEHDILLNNCKTQDMREIMQVYVYKARVQLQTKFFHNL